MVLLQNFLGLWDARRHSVFWPGGGGRGAGLGLSRFSWPGRGTAVGALAWSPPSRSAGAAASGAAPAGRAGLVPAIRRGRRGGRAGPRRGLGLVRVRQPAFGAEFAAAPRAVARDCLKAAWSPCFCGIEGWKWKQLYKQDAAELLPSPGK